MKKTTTKLTTGFTLIELLVVVAIIAILAVIGLTLFNGAQANARDARRRSDIDAISNVLETGRTPGTSYYVSLPGTSFATGSAPTDTTTAKYCIRTSTNAAIVVPADGTPWLTTDACPTGPAVGTGESAWTSIPAAGITTVGTGTLPFVANTTTFKVCARLETGAVYCKPSAQ